MSGRESMLKIVQGARDQDLLDCPICGVNVKAKNLLRHYDKMHKGQDVPSTARGTAKRSTSSSHDFDHRGTCTRCGCSRTAVESFGFKCKDEAGRAPARKVAKTSPARSSARAQKATQPKAAQKKKSQKQKATPKRPPLITSSIGAECSELLDLASVDLYRTNLFRVIGLSVGASGADVRRRQTRIEMQRKLGMNGASTQQSSLSIDPPPDAEVEREAMQRLADPEARLFDEIFWFWPLTGDVSADEAWNAVEAGRLDDAVGIWTRQQAREPGGIASHNLAVLSHLRALDAEAECAGADAHEQWGEAFRRWGEVIQGEAFWSAVRGRIGALDDQKLTTGLVRRIRGTLPKMLLLINTRIAITAAERGDTDTAKRHVGLVDDAGYGDDVVHEVRGDALSPLRRRLNSAIDTATGRWEAEPHRGCHYVREFQEQAEAVLSVVDALVPAGDLVRTSLHDSVADTMLRGQVAYGNKTNDYETSIELLQSAKKVAEGAATRAKLEEQLAVLDELNKSGNDWCSPGYWDLPEEVVEKLEEARASANVGDLDEALRVVVRLHRQELGRPLRRCLAYCLSLKGIEINNAAQDDYDGETSVLTKVLGQARPDSLRGLLGSGNDRIQQLLSSLGTLRGRPTPDMNSWELPPCTCGRGYSSWVNFTYDGMDLWMCSACNEEHESELAQTKTKLRSKILEAWEHLLLADEVDPKDKGIRRNLKAVKGVAENLDMTTAPGTRRLRKKLRIDMGALRRRPASGARPTTRKRRSLWVATGAGAVVGASAFGAAHLVPANGVKLANLLYDQAQPLMESATGSIDQSLVWGTCALMLVGAGALLGALCGLVFRGQK